MQSAIIAGVAVSGFFIIFILAKKNRKRADFLLVLMNLLMSSFLVLDMLVSQKITFGRFFLQAQLPFYLDPVFLLFALETLQKKIRAYWLLLFIPAVSTTLYISWDMFFHTYNTPALLRQLYNSPPLPYHIFYKGNQVFYICMLIWLIKKLRVYKQEIKDNFSFTEPIDLTWLTHVSWIYLAITIVSLTVFVSYNFDLVPIDVPTAYSIVSGCKVLAIFYISFHGIRQYTISEYYGKQTPEVSMESAIALPTEASDPKGKYRTSSLTLSDQEIIYQQLLKLFEEKAVYLESKLQLLDVSDLLSVTPHALSQTINAMTGKPFYDFVNGYRVKNLRRLLEDRSQKRFTILALGLESGFNSKASLNRVFKESTGLSPSEYQRHHLQNQDSSCV
jgi:AraC-like DNA-binding protein